MDRKRQDIDRQTEIDTEASLSQETGDTQPDTHNTIWTDRQTDRQTLCFGSEQYKCHLKN